LDEPDEFEIEGTLSGDNLTGRVYEHCGDGTADIWEFTTTRVNDGAPTLAAAGPPTWIIAEASRAGSTSGDSAGHTAEPPARSRNRWTRPWRRDTGF